MLHQKNMLTIKNVARKEGHDELWKQIHSAMKMETEENKESFLGCKPQKSSRYAQKVCLWTVELESYAEKIYVLSQYSQLNLGKCAQ